MNTTGNRLQIILGSHVHVPFGAGDDEFEQAYAFHLKPFISALYKFPQVQGTLHYSGALLNWVDRVYPECTMSIDDLVSRKQVELLGGGFYEPQFSLIPLQDKIGQVEMLTTYLRKRFGKKPQGCWLPAMKWEQNFVSLLSSCGMGYTFLDEDSFRSAGLSGADVYTPCVSEDQGKVIAIFPVSHALGDLCAQGEDPAGPFLAALKKLAGQLGAAAACSSAITVFPNPGKTMVSAGEAELFWHRFFESLTASLPQLDFTTPGRFIKGRGGFKKAYFPDSLVRQYLIEFPEANGLYAKMVFSHLLINQLRGDKPRKHTALEELWKAQGYDVFCPAESGGIYRGSLRKSAYRSMLEAEKITREAGAFIPSLMNFDFDLDNEDEYLFQGDRINCYIRREGASVFELDYLPRAWNYLDTFTHKKAPGSSSSKGREASFSDFLIGETMGPGDILAGGDTDREIRRCGTERFEVVEMDKTRGKISFIAGERESGPFRSIVVEKSYKLRKDTLTVSYTLSNRGEAETTFCFSPVIELSFPGDGEDYQRVFVNGTAVSREQGEGNPLTVSQAELLKFQDLKNETIITLEADKIFDAWIIPVYCAIPGEDGAPGQNPYQSTRTVPLLKVSLPPGKNWGVVFSLKFTN